MREYGHHAHQDGLPVADGQFRSLRVESSEKPCENGPLRILGDRADERHWSDSGRVPWPKTPRAKSLDL